MIIKGKARGNGAQLGRYLVTQGKNERIEVIEVRGTCALDVPGAVREMDAVSLCTRCEKPLYHASINTPIAERLTPEQRTIAVDRLEQALGFDGQPRVVVVHEKEGREHTHIVWSRTDIKHQRAIRIDHNYRAHELVARELEREFGHARVQGAHIEREGRARPDRTPTHHEMQQADRTKLNPQEVKEHITEIWQRTDTGRAFTAAVMEFGYALAPGDRRDFVVIDPHGGVHSLARCVEGANAKQVRARMADLDPRLLPTIDQAKEIQQGRAELAAKRQLDELEQEKNARPPGSSGQEWTDRAGMAEQQRAAIDWVKQAGEHRKARTEQPDRKGETKGLDQRRQALMREFGREIEEAQNELEQDGGRERTRG
jgi:hypothetical protein